MTREITVKVMPPTMPPPDEALVKVICVKGRFAWHLSADAARQLVSDLQDGIAEIDRIHAELDAMRATQRVAYTQNGEKVTR